MPPLPNYRNALCDVEMIEQIVFAEIGSEAQIFRETMGIGREKSAWLRDTILTALPDVEATMTSSDERDERWSMLIPVWIPIGLFTLRIVWIFRADDEENRPRFHYCWVANGPQLDNPPT